MQGLEDHCFAFNSDELLNGLPAQQLVDQSSAWGVKAAAGYNSSNSVFEAFATYLAQSNRCNPKQSKNIESLAR